MLAIPIALFVLLLVTCALVLRFGVRGRVPVRLLASALHLPARLGLAPATSALHQRLYRASGERLGGWWFGARILVIETTGRRSGKTRHTAVIFVPDGDRFVVTPANGGADKTPAWWLNLRERGRGAVILGGRRLPVLAYEATGSERERLWRLMLSGSPAVAEYQSFTAGILR